MRNISVEFGILDDAYANGGMSDGVCFRVTASRGALFERCLDPKAHAEDRGPQAAVFDANITSPSTLVFETQCRGNCAFDWSYRARTPKPTW